MLYLGSSANCYSSRFIKKVPFNQVVVVVVDGGGGGGGVLACVRESVRACVRACVCVRARVLSTK